MLITVSQYSFPYEAHIAKARLDSEGIPSFIADEHTINMQWLYSNALGGVKLQVPEAYVISLELVIKMFGLTLRNPKKAILER